MAKSFVTKLDAEAIARRQIKMDRQKTRWFPALFNRKVERMRASPLGFLRGSAPMFYELLSAYPELHMGPAESGWITGDLHLANFGAYRPELTDPTQNERAGKETKAVFDLNDFDEAVEGPWRLDVLRLLTSIILAARELGFDRASIENSTYELLAAYTKGERNPIVPAIINELVKKVRERKREELLDDRTVVVHGTRRFIAGTRYVPVEKSLVKQVEASLARFTAGLPAVDRPPVDHLEIIDCALRISGTGSLGSLRIAVLVCGKGVPHGCWLFDMKSEGKPAAKPMIKKQRWKKAKRVVVGMHACLQRPPKLSGTSRLLGHSMLVRRLTPQEDKLDLSHLNRHSWNEVVRYLGTLTARAHRLGSHGDSTAWSEAECNGLIWQAFQLAGIHEGIYMAFKNRTAEVRPMHSRPRPSFIPRI